MNDSLKAKEEQEHDCYFSGLKLKTFYRKSTGSSGILMIAASIRKQGLRLRFIRAAGVYYVIMPGVFQ